MTGPTRRLPSSPASPSWVVGLDVACPTPRAADHVAQRLAARLATSSTAPTDLVVATHLVPAPGGFSSHLSLSVAGSGDEAAVVRLALDVGLEESAAARTDEIGCSRSRGDSGLPGLAAGARYARDEHRLGRGGRAVVFPGARSVPETTTVEALLATTSVEAVRLLGGGEPGGHETLLTCGHVRPHIVGTRLVLDVQRASAGVLVPFERPDPTPCCADH